MFFLLSLIPPQIAMLV